MPRELRGPQYGRSPGSEDSAGEWGLCEGCRSRLLLAFSQKLFELYLKSNGKLRKDCKQTARLKPELTHLVFRTVIPAKHRVWTPQQVDWVQMNAGGKGWGLLSQWY